MIFTPTLLLLQLILLRATAASPLPFNNGSGVSSSNINSTNNKISPSQQIHKEDAKEEDMKAVRNLYAWQAATPYNDPDGLCGGGQGHGVTGYRATLDCKGEMRVSLVCYVLC